MSAYGGAVWLGGTAVAFDAQRSKRVAHVAQQTDERVGDVGPDSVPPADLLEALLEPRAPRLSTRDTH